MRIADCGLRILKAIIALAPQDNGLSLSPQETVPQVTKPVIPEVAKRLSGIQKKQYLTGYRISSAVGGLVRYDPLGPVLSSSKESKDALYA
ncbi:MAG: hypothetical protein C0610_05955 [Desulfobacteraceae bacterium]|nr:MAG: hypothetical protein C0610_05955 [Desulfobacteraceae bacterium]